MADPLVEVREVDADLRDVHQASLEVVVDGAIAPVLTPSDVLAALGGTAGRASVSRTWSRWRTIRPFPCPRARRRLT